MNKAQELLNEVSQFDKSMAGNDSVILSASSFKLLSDHKSKMDRLVDLGDTLNRKIQSQGFRDYLKELNKAQKSLEAYFKRVEK